MHFNSHLLKRFIWRWPGLLAAGAVLVAGSPATAAEDTRFVPAKRPVQKTAAPPPLPLRARTCESSPSPSRNVPADDNEGMNAVKAFIDPATGELRAPTRRGGSGAGPRDRARAARRAQAAREPMVLPNGMVVTRAGRGGNGGRRRAHRPDGKPVFSCTPRSETPKALTSPLRAEAVEEAKEER